MRSRLLLILSVFFTPCDFLPYCFAGPEWKGAFTESGDDPTPINRDECPAPEEFDGKPVSAVEHQSNARPRTISDLVADAITIRDDLPSGITSAAAKTEYIGLSPPWCGYCKPVKERLKSHSLIAIDWQSAESIIDDGKKIVPSQYPAVWNHDAKRFLVGSELSSWDRVLSVVNTHRQLTGKALIAEPVGSFSVGTIDKAILYQAMRWAGDKGSLRLGNETFLISRGPLSMAVPAKLSLDWSSSSDGVTRRFVFAEKPSVGIGAARLPLLSAITVTPRSITMEIDLAPDLTLEVK